MYEINLPEKLQQQLTFLQNSCDAFDNDCKCEAIRISTIIRILLHDTKSSKSLLGQLTAKDISLLSTISGTIPPNMSYYHGMGMAKGKSDGSKELIPNFSNSGVTALIPASEWWEQTTVKLSTGETLSRKDIVLNAANKDGGAHIDLKLNSNYQAMATDGAAGSYSRIDENGQLTNAFPSGMHWVFLRQMGYELLESTELTSLVTPLNNE